MVTILTPVYVEKATGDQMAPELEQQGGGVSADRRLTEYVNFVGSRMLPFSLRGNEKHTYKILNSDKVINAFTLGNGNIYITKGLLNMLDDEAELAEVLGHENGHFGHRHIAQQIDHGVGLGLLLLLGEGIFAGMKGGEVSDRQQSVINEAMQITQGLIINGFQRDQELEADQHGLDTMVRSGYDPMGSVRTFEKFQALEPKGDPGLEKFFQSHPTAHTRIDDLAKSIRSKYPGAAGESYSDRYQAIVKGGASLADFEGGRILGVPTPYAIAGGVALAITTGLVIASL